MRLAPMWACLWLCVAVHAVAVSSEQHLEVLDLQGATTELRVALVAPTAKSPARGATTVKPPTNAIKKQDSVVAKDLAAKTSTDKQLVELVNTEEVDDMVKHGGKDTRTHFDKLQSISLNSKHDASMTDLSNMEKSASSMVESYLNHANARATPKVSIAEAAVFKADDSVKALRREARVLKQQAKIDKALVKQTSVARKYQDKLRGAAEVVVKAQAKRIDAANEAFASAKAVEKKARAAVPTKGQKQADAALTNMGIAAVKQKLVNLKLKRAMGEMKVVTNAYVDASDKVLAAKRLLELHGSNAKTAQVKKVIAEEASKQAKQDEESAISKQKRDAKLMRIKKAEAAQQAHVLAMKKKVKAKRQSLVKALEQSKKSGDDSDALNVQDLQLQYSSVTKQQTRNEVKFESSRLEEQKVRDNFANSAVELNNRGLKRKKEKVKQASEQLNKAKLETQKQGRESQRDMASAASSKDPQFTKNAKNSLREFQNSEAKVQDLQANLARESRAMSSLEATHTRVLSKAAEAKLGLSREQLKMRAMKSTDSLDREVNRTLARAAKAQARAAPEQIALQSEAVGELQSERDIEGADEEKIKSIRTKLDLARETQMSAAKTLRKLIEAYFLKIKSDSPSNKKTAEALAVSNGITNLQKAQFEVEKFKSTKTVQIKRLVLEKSTLEQGISAKVSKLKRQTEPNEDDAQEKKNTIDVNGLIKMKSGPGYRFVQSVQDLKQKKGEEKQAKKNFDEAVQETKSKILKADVKPSANVEAKVDIKLKLATKELQNAKNSVENAEMDKVAYKMAFDETEKRKKKISNEEKMSYKSISKKIAQAQDQELRAKRLARSEKALTEAALLGDSDGMANLIKESIADNAKPIDGNKFRKWIQCLEAGKSACPLIEGPQMDNSKDKSKEPVKTGDEYNYNDKAKEKKVQNLENSIKNGKRVLPTDAMNNSTTPQIAKIEADAIAKHLAIEDKQALKKEKADANKTKEEGITRKEYMETRMLKESDGIKDQKSKDKLAIEFDQINDPDQRGMTRKEYREAVNKLENKNSHPTVDAIKDFKHGVSKEAFEVIESVRKKKLESRSNTVSSQERKEELRRQEVKRLHPSRL